MQSAAKLPSGQPVGRISGANSVEKMDFMDSMGDLELTPSRGWTEITPINAIFSHPIGFEVRRTEKYYPEHFPIPTDIYPALTGYQALVHYLHHDKNNPLPGSRP